MLLRREFIKQSAATAGIVLASKTPVFAQAEAEMKKSVTVQRPRYCHSERSTCLPRLRRRQVAE